MVHTYSARAQWGSMDPAIYQVARSWNWSKQFGILYSPILNSSEMFNLQFIEPVSTVDQYY